MKTIFFVLVFVVTGTYSYAQKKFTLNSSIGATAVQINGKKYQVDSTGTKIKTNYPKFDTLVFLGDGPNFSGPIICNFKPDTVYSISLACCGSLDIIPASKLKNDSLSLWDYEKDFEKIQNQLMDRPFISIRTLNPPKDAIYAWHADAACETEQNVIHTELWQLGVPPKCFYWNNITIVQFFKTDNTLPKHETTDLEEFLSIDNIVVLTDISFRLFDDQRFVIVYDEKKGKTTLQYE